MPNMPDNGFTMQDAARLAKSPAGKQLFEILQKQNQQSVQQIMSSLSGGDYQKAQALIQGMMSDPNIKKALQQLGR